MSVPHLHPDDGYLLDYATGNLATPFAVLIASHLTLCPACRNTVRAFEGVGGALLRTAEPTSVAADRLATVMQRLDRPLTVAAPPPPPALSGFGHLPRPLQRFLAELPERPFWRRAFFGLETVRIPRFGDVRSRLMRIAPGGAIPRHTHQGNELLIVLDGGYSDHTGEYDRGDVAYGDAGLVHKPRADAERGCLCFSVWDAPPRMVGLLAPLLNRLLTV
ncbi:MAG: ChrR family anti-sigma-E factor [Aliidongia sp.]